MTATTGTYSLDDLRANRFQSSVAFGLSNIDSVLQAELAAVNGLLTERLGELAVSSSDVQRIYGVNGRIMPVRVDEFGRAPTRKEIGGATVGFPLIMRKTAVGWTSKYLEIAPPAEIAEQFLKVRTGHFAQVNNEITKALFDKDNFTHRDQEPDGTDGVDIFVKRLLNADSAPIPNSPGGATFDATTHTHYLARVSTLANSDIDGLIAHITEHGHTKGLRIILHQSDRAAVAALSKFVALTGAGLIVTTGTERRLDTSDVENQLIGYWGDASVEVWVKPWGYDGYIFAYASGADEKVLVRRERPQASLTGLRLIERLPGYPVLSDNFESEYGFGVWNRSAGAILYIDGTSYTDPDLSALG
jgi:hypothetical protein